MPKRRGRVEGLGVRDRLRQRGRGEGGEMRIGDTWELWIGLLKFIL